MILRLPCLKLNSLTLTREDEPEPFVLVDNIERSSTIESLFINHSCTLNELTNILRHTPHLSCLNCQHLMESDDHIEDALSITLPNLTHITIENCYVEFRELKKFLQGIYAPHLKTLQCGEFSNPSYTEPHWWEQLISQSIPQLHRFTVKCAMTLDENFRHLHFDAFVQQMNSRFWFKRQCVLRLEIKPQECFYVICPERYSRKENLFQIFNDQKIDDPSSLYLPIKELSITNLDNVKWYSSFLDKLIFILQGIQFRILNISCPQMPIPILTKIIRLLPNLDSLKIESLSVEQLTHLSDEDVANLLLVSNSNRITKVWQSVQCELTHFLILLCPHMEHFEITGVQNEDLEKLVRDILMKTITDIPRLHSLQLNVRNGNDQLINHLQTMIDSKELLSKYIIKRRCDDIILQWE